MSTSAHEPHVDSRPMVVRDGQTFLTIGEVAAEAGVSAQTLRVWEAQGLVLPDRSPGGQRLYNPDHVARAKQVAELRRRHGWNPAAIRTALAGQGAVNPSTSQWNGERIRRARRARELTLKEAAARIGVSASYLASIERGESEVSTQLVSRIADAFLVPWSALATFRARDPMVVRHDERAQGVFGGGVTWEELVLPGHSIEPSLLTVPPGEGSGGAYARPGETFAFVLAGRLRYVVEHAEAGGEIVLDEGDSLIVPPGTPCAWDNPGPEQARALVVETVPPAAWSEPLAAEAVARTRRGGGRG